MEFDFLVGILVIAMFVVMYAVEVVRPGREFPKSPRWFWIGIVTVLVLLGINVLVQILIPEEWLSRGVLFNARSWGLFPSVLVGILATSFVDYWFHRAEHRFGWIWRIHQLHHSPVRMDISGFVYTHPLEVFILSIEGLLVCRMLLNLDPMAVLFANIFVTFCFQFQHWNVKTPVWLGYLLQRPESHCIHHKVDHHASNYSSIPMWDMLFGTFENPEQFIGQVGFTEGRSEQVLKMLMLKDVHEME